MEFVVKFIDSKGNERVYGRTESRSLAYGYMDDLKNNGYPCWIEKVPFVRRAFF